MHPTPLPPPSPRQATFREFLAIVFRRRGIILGIFAVTTATVAVIVFTTPTEYLSAGRVLVKRGEQTSVLQSDRRLFDDWEQELGSEMELVRSEPVLAEARRLLEAEPLKDGSPATLDRASVGVEVLGKSNVLSIGYVSGNAELAQRACDAVVRAYVEFRQNHLGMVSYPRTFFEQSLGEVNRELQRALDRRRRFTSEQRIADPVEERRTLLNETGSLRLRESELRAELVAAQTAARVMRELRARPEINSPLGAQSEAADMSAILELNRRLVEQEARVAQLLERYREESAEVQNARQTIQTLRNLRDREVDSRIEVAQSRIEVLESQLGAVRDDLQRAETRLADTPDNEVTLGEIDREIALLRSRYSELMEKSDLARITQNTTSNVTVLVLEAAGTAVPANARDWVRLALAPAFSLLVGIGIAFFVDGLDVRIRTAPQAEEASNIPVLASLPERRRRRA